MNLGKWSIILSSALAIALSGKAMAGEIAPQLAERMAQARSDELIRVYIVMDRQVSLAELKTIFKGLDKETRRQTVIDRLREVAEEDQRPVLSILEKAEATGRAELIRALWLGNTVVCQATQDVIRQLSAMEEIGYIQWDKLEKVLREDRAQRRAQLFQQADRTLGTSGQETSVVAGEPDADIGLTSSKEITWGITKINADDVWALGYTGSGVVVGHLDTGVNYNHLDLKDHMWDGSGVGMPHHGYDFANGDLDPMDDHGHGTHTAGTIASDGTAGSQVGVAPDAQIMIFKIWDDEGHGTQSSAWSAMQYSLSWGADLVSMSGGWLHTSADLCSWRVKCDQLLAAGVVFSVAAGNGDDAGGHYTVPDDIGTPADVPAPWYPLPNPGDVHHSAIIAVGATNSTDGIAIFSSYGPTEWAVTGCGSHDYDDYLHPPGLLKPEVSAPGVSIKSCAYNNNAGYLGPANWSGTSMSCPHVTGTLALMLSKNPELTPVQMDSILEVTAVDKGLAGRDSLYGAGRIDALAAVNATPLYGQPPEAIDDLSATLTNLEKSATGGIFLNWSEPYSDLGIDHYVVYRSGDPEGAMDSLEASFSTNYIDADGVGDILNNFYYTVKAVDIGGQKSDESNKVGEFDIYLMTAP